MTVKQVIYCLLSFLFLSFYNREVTALSIKDSTNFSYDYFEGIKFYDTSLKDTLLVIITAHVTVGDTTNTTPINFSVRRLLIRELGLNNSEKSYRIYQFPLKSVSDDNTSLRIKSKENTHHNDSIFFKKHFSKVDSVICNWKYKFTRNTKIIQYPRISISFPVKVIPKSNSNR